MRGRFAHRSGLASRFRFLAFGAKALAPWGIRAMRVGLAGFLALVLALPRGAWAQQEAEGGWPFDPQERYDAAHNAFEVQEYRLAIELWMDVLSHPKCSELGGEMVRLIGQNLVSALVASFKQVAGADRNGTNAGYLRVHEDAMRFCSLYEYFQEGETYSEPVEDACIKWIEEEQARSQGRAQGGPVASSAQPGSEKQGHPAARVAPPAQVGTVQPGAPPFRGRPPQLKAGIGMLVSAGVASGFSVIGMIAEGRAMRNYHTSIHNNEAKPQLRERADAWRTASVVSGGVSLALITVGVVLSLAGSRSGGLALRPQKTKRTAWRVRPRGLALRF